MKSTGIVRLVDELGRVVLPIELRRVLGIDEGTAIEIYVNDKQIMLKVYQGTACYFCGRADGQLVYFKAKLICDSCRSEILHPFRVVAATAEPAQAIPSDSETSEGSFDDRGITKRGRKYLGEMGGKLDELMATYPQAKQHELAKMLNISQAYVSHLIRKKAKPGGPKPAGHTVI